MKKILLGMVLTLVGATLVVSLVAATGLVSVAADEPHSKLVYDVLTLARERSIARRVGGIAIPDNLDDEKRMQRGTRAYDAKCAACHLRPGESDSALRAGLYPRPPSLVSDADHDDHEHEHASIDERARRFWIIKHGIKASGMPAWSRSGMSDEAIWDLVAVLGRLSHTSAERYGALLAMAQDGGQGQLSGESSPDLPVTPASHAPAIPNMASMPHDGDASEETRASETTGTKPHVDDGHGH